MRYMMLLSGTSPPAPPSAELFEAIMKLGGEATQAGVLLDTAGLLPSASGARVSLAGGTPRSRRSGGSSRLASSRRWPGSPGTWARPRSWPRTPW